MDSFIFNYLGKPTIIALLDEELPIVMEENVVKNGRTEFYISLGQVTKIHTQDILESQDATVALKYIEEQAHLRLIYFVFEDEINQSRALSPHSLELQVLMCRLKNHLRRIRRKYHCQ